MSKLQELIKELCPDGVEFRKLGEVCEIKRGVRVVKNDLINDGKYPVFQNSLIPLGYYDKNNYPANITFVISAGAAGEIGYTEEPIWAADDCLAIISPNNIINKFIYYCLIANKLFFVSKVRRASVPRLSRTVVDNFEIPIPPLEVQNEIVRILDTFTSHAAELQAELQARKEQYEYYRNKLLTFDENDERVKWMTLGEVCFYPRQRIPVSLLHKNNYVGVDNLLPNKQGKKESNCVPSEGSCLSYTINDILIGNIRPYLKKIWISNNNGGTNGDVLIYRIREEFLNCVMPKYLYYILSSDDFFDFDNQYAKGAKMPRGDKNMNMKYSVPIPLLSEQQRIISILDKFESLVNDLSEGLPAEIAAVQEQYEYYRNKLLTFKRKS